MFVTLFNSRFGTLLYLMLRVLAVVDACLIPGLVMWWFYQQPKHGGMAGSIAAVFMGWWALKRGSRALFVFEEYSWIVVKLAMIWAIAVAFHLVMKYWPTLG